MVALAMSSYGCYVYPRAAAGRRATIARLEILRLLRSAMLHQNPSDDRKA